MFYAAVMPPPQRSPTITTSKLPPSPQCPRCNTQLATSQVLRSPINVSTSRFASSSISSPPPRFKDERIENWRHLCGLDVSFESDDEDDELQNSEGGQEEDGEGESDDGYDDRKPYAALGNSPSPPNSPIPSKSKPRLTSEEREHRRQRREEWVTLTSHETSREKELREALEQAMGALDSLTKVNTELQNTHQDLQASLKIARSNLAMAEANSEMLEDSLRRGTGTNGMGSMRSPVTPSGLGLGGTGTHKRVSSEAAKDSKGGFGFWNRFKDSPAPAAAATPATGSSLSSPIQETKTPRSPTQVLAQSGHPTLQRSSSYSTLPSPTAPTTTQAKVLSALSAECAELKRSKAALEDELEGLSQALFEEANKMVADERRKLAEKEDEVREAREERDALRRTIRVLGGGKPDASEPAPESIPLPPATPPPSSPSKRNASPSNDPPNPWAAQTLEIPPRDEFLPSLDRPRTPAEDLDGLLKEMEGEYGK